MTDDRPRQPPPLRTIGSAFLAKVAQRLATIDPETLEPDDLARWADVALRLEQAGDRGETYDREARLREILRPDWAQEDTPT
jgi:hypothetical protein